jgi:hypothetical protein
MVIKFWSSLMFAMNEECLITGCGGQERREKQGKGDLKWECVISN